MQKIKRMSNITSSEIFLLIKTLSKDEPQLFARYARQRLQPQALGLFRLMNESETNDEKSFARRLKIKSEGTFQTTKSNLKACLYDFLILQERKQMPFKWIYELEQCTMLFNRKRFSESYRKTENLIKEIKANSISQGNLIMAGAQVLKNRLITLVADEKSEENHISNIGELLANLQSVSDSVIAYRCYLESALLHQSDLFLRKETSRSKLIELNNNPLLKQNPEQLPYDQKFYITVAKASLAFVEGDYNKFFELEMPHWKERLALIKQKTGIDENERMKDWNNILDTCYFADKEKELKQLLDEGYALFKPVFSASPEYLNTWLVYRYKLFLVKKNPIADESWYKDALIFWEANKENNNVSNLSKISLNYCLMLYCFFNNNWKKATAHRNMVFSFSPKPDVMTPLQEVCEVFNLFVFFEKAFENKEPKAEDVESLAVEATRIREKHRKKEGDYQLEILLADFFLVIAKENNQKLFSTRFKQLKSELDKSKIGYLVHFHKYFDLSEWIERRI